MDWLFNSIYNAKVDFYELKAEYSDKEEYVFLKAAAHSL
jgi:hypothetical protein